MTDMTVSPAVGILLVFLLAAGIVAIVILTVNLLIKRDIKRAEELAAIQQPCFAAAIKQAPSAEHITGITFFDAGEYTTIESFDERGYPQKRMMVIDELVLPSGEKVEYLRLLKLPRLRTNQP
jgi:hypothetical protein